MNKVLLCSIATLGLIASGLTSAVFILPRVNWSATAAPGNSETRIANYIIREWIKRKAGHQINPLSETAANVQSAKREFTEHCSLCHGLDGSGQNRLEAEFYPPIPQINALQSWTDAELFFVIANGIRLSAMPGFSAHHSAEDIWKSVLWVRHLPKLTPTERETIKSEIGSEAEAHEKTMEPMRGDMKMRPQATPNP